MNFYYLLSLLIYELNYISLLKTTLNKTTRYSRLFKTNRKALKFLKVTSVSSNDVQENKLTENPVFYLN